CTEPLGCELSRFLFLVDLFVRLALFTKANPSETSRAFSSVMIVDWLKMSARIAIQYRSSTHEVSCILSSCSHRAYRTASEALFAARLMTVPSKALTATISFSICCTKRVENRYQPN